MRIGFGLPLSVMIEARGISKVLRNLLRPRGPFMLVGRNSGLALDTGRGHDGDSPILWPAHGEPQQLWNFRRTSHRGQYLIVSVDNGLALDARRDDELRRRPVMWERHGEAHQRWRLHRAEGEAAFVVESVRTGHALDVPKEAVEARINAERKDRATPVLWNRHGSENQQWLIVAPFRLPV